MRGISLWLATGVCCCLLFGLADRPASGWEEDRLLDLRYFNVPRSDLKDEDGEIGMDAVRAAALLPVGLTESSFLLTGLVYNGLYLNYRGLEFSEPTPDGDFTEKDLPKNLHVVDLVLGGGVGWDERWGTVLILYPGFHSDFDDVSGKDIYFSGAALATYQISEDLTLSAGAYYDDSFGHPQLLPILGAQWRIGETLTLEAFIPQFAVLAWQFDPAISAGLKCSVEGSQYRLREGHPWKNTVVEYSQILAGPFVDINLAGDLFLRLEGGVVFSRVFEFRDDDSDAKLFDGDIEDTGYAGLSLSCRY